MASPKNAVSLLTAAALVVAPVGGVAATYQTAHADSDGARVYTANGNSLPASYSELKSRIGSGEHFTQGDLELMKANGFFSDEGQYANAKNLIDEQAAAEKAEAEAEKAAVEKAEAEAEKAAAEKKAAEEAEKAEKDAQADAAGSSPAVAEGGQESAPAKDAATDSGDSDAPSADDPATQVPSGDASDMPGDSGEEGGDASTDPNEPTGPAGPSDPNESADPSEPADPNKPADPGDSVGPADPAEPTEPGDSNDPTDPATPNDPDTPSTPDGPATPSAPDTPAADEPAPSPATGNPVDNGQQMPSADGATGMTPASHVAAAIKGEAQTPLKQAAVSVPSISFTYMDNSAYVARHYTEDLTTEKFIALIGEPARAIAAENDLYASVMIAQAILESGSGNSTLAQAPNNNLFGIKGVYQGNSVQLPTREDDGTGSTYTIKADFRQYDTVAESLSDYADLLGNSMGNFYAGARKSNTETFVDACDFLVGRYATDIFYSEKLQDLIETYDLTRFDVPLTYELADVIVAPATDDEGRAVYLDPVRDEAAYDELVAEYEAYAAAQERQQEQAAEGGQATREESAARGAHVRTTASAAASQTATTTPVSSTAAPLDATAPADTPTQRHKDAVDAERFAGFDELIAAGAPLPVREERTLEDLTTLATSFLGVPYLWGGTTSAGFDCSGLVQYCYREALGIELPRTTYYQCEVGEEVSFDELLPGDLLFFERDGRAHHVGMYLGDGFYVEAPHTGDVVKITSMDEKLPDFAKRVVDVRDIDLSEYTDEQLSQFVERERYLQEREQRLGADDETLDELVAWLESLEF